MGTAKAKPELVLEDLEAMDSGITLDDMIAGDTLVITEETPVKAALDDLEAIVTEDTPNDEEPALDLTEDASIEEAPEPLIEEPSPEPPPVETPKRTRRTKAEIEAAKLAAAKTKITFAEDDGLIMDDLDSCSDMPDLVSVDPFEALIEDVGTAPEWVTIVAYGKNGTGKTTFGASGDQTLVAEVEKDGTFSVRDRGSKAKRTKIKSWQDFENLYWYIRRNPYKYKILCIDTLTRLRELCLRSVVLNKKEIDAELKDKDIVRVTLPQHGDIGQRMIFWLNAFAELPLHKMWICQEASGSEDKDVANVDAYPDLPRKVRTYVCSDATIIARMEKRFKTEVDKTGKEIVTVKYCMLVKPSESYLSKDRTNVLGTGLVNPKIDKLIEKVYA